MADSDDSLSCKIYVDSELSALEMCESIAGVLNCDCEENNRINCRWGVIVVRANEDADGEKAAEHGDNFVCYPLCLEVEPGVQVKNETYINGVTVVLRHLWGHWWRAVASCDFAADLPNKAGLDFDPTEAD